MNLYKVLFDVINLITIIAPIMFIGILISNAIFSLSQFRIILGYV